MPLIPTPAPEQMSICGHWYLVMNVLQSWATVLFGAGGREREYQWLWKQSPAVRRTLVNVRGVIAVMEVAQDLFSSNQKHSFFIVQASNMRHTTCIYGNCFHAEVPPGYQSVHTLQTTVLMACLSQFTGFYISIGE